MESADDQDNSESGSETKVQGWERVDGDGLSVHKVHSRRCSKSSNDFIIPIRNGTLRKDGYEVTESQQPLQLKKHKGNKRLIITCGLLLILSFACSVVALVYCVPRLLTLQDEYNKVFSDLKFTQELKNFTNLYHRVLDFNRSLIAMDSVLAGAKEEIKHLQNEVADANQDIESGKETTKNLTELIEEIQAEIARLQAAVGKNNGTIEQINLSISSLEDEDKRLKESISQNAEASQDLEEENKQLKASISENDYAIQRLNSKIAELERKVEPNGATRDVPRAATITLLFLVVRAVIARAC